MQNRPADFFETSSDSIGQWLASISRAPDPPPVAKKSFFQLNSWSIVDQQQEVRFMALFNKTDWAFIGSTSRQRVDTTRSRDLRARMQALFGDPTRTLAEIGPIELLAKDEIIEFEYWFVLNDSIPVIVIDTNGPWDRGVVLASAADYRPRLSEIKAAFLGQLMRSDQRSLFADYYYNSEQEQWYVTGFDGASFFDTRIGRPDLTRGRPDPVFYSDLKEHTPN